MTSGLRSALGPSSTIDLNLWVWLSFRFVSFLVLPTPVKAQP